MSHFNLAQTFFVDPSLVQNAFQVVVTKINLYFKLKPGINGNKSGIFAPGCEVRIAPTYLGIPLLSTVSPVARNEYGEINASSTAQTPTIFNFSTPIKVRANKEYAIVIKFDGDEDFVLWENVKGEKLLDATGGLTNIVSTGAMGKYIGKLFSYISPTYDIQSSITNADLTSDSIIPSVSTQLGLDQIPPDVDYLLNSWKPFNDIDLKFQVRIARYSHALQPVAGNTELLANVLIDFSHSDNIEVLANNSLRLTSPCYPVEYIQFDKKTSFTEDLHFGDAVYQSQPYYPGGTATPATVAVSNGSVFLTTPNNYVYANGSTLVFGDLFIESNPEFIVVVSLNHHGAGAHEVNVRRVFGYFSNTTLTMSEPFTFTNNAAYFFKSPVASLYSKSRPYVSGFTTDLIILNNSNANDSCRFVNNCITNATITSMGAGYNNSDYITVSGFEAVTNEVLGGYAARANVVTYANGSLQSIYFSNNGAGFVYTGNITFLISNSMASPSVGTGANLSFTTGATLFTEKGNGNVYFSNCVVKNFEAQNLLPSIKIDNPPGTLYSMKFKSLYSSANSANTYSGRKHYIDVNDSEIVLDVINNKVLNFPANKHPTIVSRSNQFVIGYANGYIPNTSISGYKLSNTAVLYVDMYANNDYTSIGLNPTELYTYYAKYNINNDYTGEWANYGNAHAKHITTKINFANGQFAEDLLVFVTAYKPPGTDIQVLARLHNSHDPEAFDDKDWSILQLIDGIGVYTSVTNQTDRVDLTYGLRLYPNTGTAVNTSVTPTSGTLGGVVNTALNSATLTGVGTTFSSNLVAGDLIKLYQPLFANTDYMVAVVNVVTSNTILTINSPVTNNSLVASGMKIDKISFPQQAFKNLTGDNVARYYSKSLVEYDTFDTVSLKVIMLSPDDYVVPKIDDIRLVGVTS